MTRWILAFVLLLPVSAFAEAKHICFTEPEAAKILHVLETSDILSNDLVACEDMNDSCDNLVMLCNEQLEYRGKEINDLVRQREEVIKMLDDAQKAIKVAGKGSLWERIKSNALAAGVGGLIVLLLVAL